MRELPQLRALPQRIRRRIAARRIRPSHRRQWRRRQHGAGGASTGTDASSSATDAGAIDYSVLQHHKNGTRNGVYTDPILTKATAATMHVLGFMGTVSQAVYAQPLYVENGPGGSETVIIATETNHVTAFNAATGAVIWDRVRRPTASR